LCPPCLPKGRIIARFVSDTRTLDGELTEFTRSVLDTTITLLIKLATIAFVVPVFGLAGLVLGCIGAFVAELYIHAQMSCKRESSNKKSPLFSHFGDGELHGAREIWAQTLTDADQSSPHQPSPVSSLSGRTTLRRP
jgi:hypothetical protein